MKREELTEKILDAKRAQNLTWARIASAIDPAASPIVMTAALLGEMRLEKDQADRAADFLGLTELEACQLQEVPTRGTRASSVSTDPLIYRFQELIMVYGTTLKELIQEEFGDGIMSAIDFDMALERQPDPKGDRVKLTLSGKFLSYKRY